MTELPGWAKQLCDAQPQEIVPPELRAQGWIYWDPPGKFSFEMWDYLLSLIGEGEYKIIIQSRGQDWVRGQLLISPAGQANMNDKSRR